MKSERTSISYSKLPGSSFMTFLLQLLHNLHSCSYCRTVIARVGKSDQATITDLPYHTGGKFDNISIKEDICWYNVLFFIVSVSFCIFSLKLCFFPLFGFSGKIRKSGISRKCENSKEKKRNITWTKSAK